MSWPRPQPKTRVRVGSGRQRLCARFVLGSKGTRANLIERFKDGTYVYPSAQFAPTTDEIVQARRNVSDWAEGGDEDDIGGGEGEGTRDGHEGPEDGADAGSWSDSDRKHLPAAAE